LTLKYRLAGDQLAGEFEEFKNPAFHQLQHKVCPLQPRLPIFSRKPIQLIHYSHFLAIFAMIT